MLDLSERTVLIVDDEPQMLRLLRRFLTPYRCNVLEANAVGEALRLLSADHVMIDLLLTDMVLPDGSGTDLGDQARGLRPGLSLAYMSGYSREILGARGAGIDDALFLRKPFERDKLEALLSAALPPGPSATP